MLRSYTDLLSIIEEEIRQNPFSGSPANLYEPLNYILDLGGKRIRPVLVLMGCELYSGKIEKALPAAMAVEIFHNFSLIHDDIMDNAPFRRGKPAVHAKWDVPTAILSGDLMLAKAYEFLLRSEQQHWPELTWVFNNMVTRVCEGQQMDMNFETQEVVSEEDYLEMIRLKTSVLLGCSLQMGAIAAGIEKEEALKVYNLGINLGMGFQLMDDYLDAFGNYELFGKQQGGDILSGKKTLMAIHAIKTDKENFKDLFERYPIDKKEKIEMVKSLYIKNGSDVYLKNLSGNYFSLAYQDLDSVKSDDHNRTYLKDLLASLQNRSF